SFADKLAEKKILVSDGAWGTELAKAGVDTVICPEMLNIEQPDIIRGVAASYVEAGSDIILTNTFGGSPFKLKKYELADRLDELNRAGVRLSKEAAGDRAMVFGSLGPTGEFLEPLGLTTEDEMIEGFAAQVKAAVAEGADGIVVESMTDLGEVTCALRAAKENSSLPVVCSMTFDKGQKGYATMMGVKPDEAARALEAAGADAVGSNCGWGIDEIIEVAQVMRSVTSCPLWFKPNAGMPELIDGKTVYRQTPDYMASKTAELIEAGAVIVGGCCGSTPDHLREIRGVVDGLT
ncbi:homocysteine S-methyltransferase family protein, partial [Candidatus Latescibacterota bacterium]